MLLLVDITCLVALSLSQAIACGTQVEMAGDCISNTELVGRLSYNVLLTGGMPDSTALQLCCYMAPHTVLHFSC